MCKDKTITTIIPLCCPQSVVPQLTSLTLTLLLTALTLTLLLTPPCAAGSGKRRGGRSRPSRRAPDKCPAWDGAKLQADYQQEVAGSPQLGLHESFYQMDYLREAFPDNSFQGFVNRSRGPVQIVRAPLDSESHYG